MEATEAMKNYLRNAVIDFLIDCKTDDEVATAVTVVTRLVTESIGEFVGFPQCCYCGSRDEEAVSYMGEYFCQQCTM